MSGAELDFEQTRVQFVSSLAGLAEHFRQCAHYAEQMAAFLNAGHMPPMAIPPMMPPPIATPEHHANGHKRKAEVLEDEDEGGKKRKSRKPKDPNAPKRPPSSYILFQNEVRKEIKARNPNIQNHELLQMISQQWAGMTPDQKNVYVEAMAKAKEAYTQEKAAYDARSPEEIAAAEAALAVTQAAKKVRKPRAKASGEPAAKKKKAAAPAVVHVEEVTDEMSGEEDDDEEEDDEEDEGPTATTLQHGDDDSSEEEEEEDEEEDEEDQVQSSPSRKKRAAAPLKTKNRS